MPSRTASEGDAVVVPAVSAPSSLACVRSLGRRGIRTIVVSERESSAAFSSTYCDEAYVTPDPARDISGYADVLCSLARRPDVRTVLPVREYDILALARRRGELSEHVGTPWPTAEALSKVQDRLELYDVAASAGVDVPRTEPLSACEEWDREQIVKARYAVPPALLGAAEFDGGPLGTPGTTYLEPGRAPPEGRLRFSMGHDPIVQAYVPGDEYGFFAVYDRGEALATFQHRQRRGYKYCGGPSAFRESIDDPALEAAGRALLDELSWHGVAMVEFKRDPETGAYRLMEVNPRFWSSLPFTVQAGADFPHHAWLLATGRADEITPGYEVGVAGHLLRGELLYLHSVFRETYPLVPRPGRSGALRDVLTSIVRHPRFDYPSADDPAPFLSDLRNFVVDTIHPGRTPLTAPPRAAVHGEPSLGATLERPATTNGESAAESRVEESAHRSTR